MTLRGGCRKIRFVVSSFSSCAARLRYSTVVRVLLRRTVARRFIWKRNVRNECGRRSLLNVVLYENVNEILYWVWFGPNSDYNRVYEKLFSCANVVERRTKQTQKKGQLHGINKKKLPLWKMFSKPVMLRMSPKWTLPGWPKISCILRNASFL